MISSSFKILVLAAVWGKGYRGSSVEVRNSQGNWGEVTAAKWRQREVVRFGV